MQQQTLRRIPSYQSRCDNLRIVVRLDVFLDVHQDDRIGQEVTETATTAPDFGISVDQQDERTSRQVLVECARRRSGNC